MSIDTESSALGEGERVDMEQEEAEEGEKLQPRQRKKAFALDSGVSSEEQLLMQEDGLKVGVFEDTKIAAEYSTASVESSLSIANKEFSNGNHNTEIEELDTSLSRSDQDSEEPSLVLTPEAYRSNDEIIPHTETVRPITFDSPSELFTSGQPVLSEHSTESQKLPADAETTGVGLEDYDLEKILAEQETHDLYCPNCSSCITKRVILRKRKRTSRVQSNEPPKRTHYEESPQIVQDESSVPDAVPQEREVFRCLSCFSFFIPIDGGFNIFDMFGRKAGMQDQQSSQRSNENCSSWLLSCFQGPSEPRITQPVQAGTSSTLSEVKSSIAKTNEGDAPSAPELETSSTGQKAVLNKIDSRKVTVQSQGQTTTAALKPLEEAVSDSTAQLHPPYLSTRDTDIEAPAEARISLPKGTEVAEEEIVLQTEPLYVTDDAFRPSRAKTRVLDDQEIGPSAVQIVNPYGDTVVDIEGELAREEDSWDILKAIVYGGLTESIAILSIVSSAASAQLATWKIVILGLASIIGGLVVILHNISELRNTRDADLERDERASCYWVQLGRRSKHGLHIVIAAISYLLFGILPLVVYAFSFKKSDNREYKLLSTAAVSLSCIGLLAIGKAHVRLEKKYFQTFLYYLSAGIAASGLSYVSGVLLTKLMEQIGLINGDSSPHTPPSLLSSLSSGGTYLSNY